MKLKLVFISMFFSHLAYGENAYIEGNSLVVAKDGQVKTYKMPPDLAAANTFHVNISKEELRAQNIVSQSGSGESTPNVAGPQKSPTPGPQDVNQLIGRANKLFLQRKYTEALRLLEIAEEVAPKNHRVRTMKGSLYYALGDDELAKENWENSLKINSQQDSVKKILDSLNSSAEGEQE